MQTFITYRTFAKTAAGLDMMRLGKQRAETIQILKALRKETDAYANHPAVGMWRGYEECLVYYGLIITHEWRVIRKFQDNTWGRFADYAKDYGMLDFIRTDGGSVQWTGLGFEMPPWIGEDWVLRSHRSNLIRKMPHHYGEQFGATPDNMPYLWPVFDDTHRHGYRLYLSRPDFDRVKNGERELPRILELNMETREVTVTQ